MIIRRPTTYIPLVLAFFLCAVLFSQASAKTISVWTNQPEEKEMRAVMQEAFDSYERTRSGAKVEWTNQGTDYYNKVTVSIAAGVGPDALYVRPGSDRHLRAKGMVIDLDGLVRRDEKELNTKDYIPAQLTELTYDGRWWALPYDYSDIGLYYNKDIFDAAGLFYPNESSTWETVLQTAQKLTRRDDAGKTTQWGLGNITWFLSQWAEGFIMSNGGRIFNEALTAASARNQGMIELLRYHTRIGAESHVTPLPGEPTGENEWQAGKAAMTLQGSWATMVVRSYARFSYDVSVIPSGSQGRVVSATGGAWSITSNAQDVEAAWSLVKSLASREASRTLIVKPVRSLPPRQSLFGEWAQTIAASGPPANAISFAEAVINYGRNVPPVDFNYAQVLGPFRNRLLKGDISAEEAALQIEHNLNVKLQEVAKI
jgi:multiple sugar transport system substrate-binding protein